jgi:hypothetical protein
MALLLSCRQIYHEAVGMFYGQNTFIISRVPAHHHNGYDIMQHNDEYSQIAYAPRWISSLGSQAGLLKQVIIDVDTLCQDICLCHRMVGGVLPLAQLLWAFPERRNVITLGNSGRVSTGHMMTTDNEGHGIGDRAVTLNNILTAMVLKDSLMLQRYAYSSHLLESINVTRNLKRGWIKFKRDDPDLDRDRHFLISDEGKTVAWELQDHLQLHMLPDTVWSQIYKFACFNPNGVTIDLDTSTLHGLGLGIFQLNQRLRPSRFVSTCISRFNTVHIKMTSNNLVTDFDKFHPLLRELDIKSSRRRVLANLTLPGRLDVKPVIISLQIVVSTIAAQLSDVRINIKELMRVLADISFPKNSKIHLTLSCGFGARN